MLLGCPTGSFQLFCFNIGESNRQNEIKEIAKRLSPPKLDGLPASLHMANLRSRSSLDFWDWIMNIDMFKQNMMWLADWWVPSFSGLWPTGCLRSSIVWPRALVSPTASVFFWVVSRPTMNSKFIEIDNDLKWFGGASSSAIREKHQDQYVMVMVLVGAPGPPLEPGDEEELPPEAVEWSGWWKRAGEIVGWLGPVVRVIASSANFLWTSTHRPWNLWNPKDYGGEQWERNSTGWAKIGSACACAWADNGLVSHMVVFQNYGTPFGSLWIEFQSGDTERIHIVKTIKNLGAIILKSHQMVCLQGVSLRIISSYVIQVQSQHESTVQVISIWLTSLFRLFRSPI